MYLDTVANAVVVAENAIVRTHPDSLSNLSTVEFSMTVLRIRTLIACLGLSLVAFGSSAIAEDAKWVTVKGQVKLSDLKLQALAKPALLNVTTDVAHCQSKGPLTAEDLIVNPKNGGVKNVWVYLKPATGDVFAPEAIHPDLANAKPKEIVIDQPCCQFIPRAFAARTGDTLLIKNSSPVPHNTNFNSDDLSFNQTIAAGGEYKPEKALKAQKSQATYACNIHPWMKGLVMIFDHPYYAVTDADGKYEIKDAPAGAIRVFYRHEGGFHMGKDGAKGFPNNIAGATMELKPIDLELPAK